MSKPLSWKWKLTIALTVFFLLFLGFIFTPFGHDTIKDYLDAAYEETPPAERINSPIADWFIFWAWWQGSLCLRQYLASELYEEFLGIIPETEGGNFFREWTQRGAPKWKGKFDPKTKTGWGFFHPRACEVYYNYLLHSQTLESSQFTAEKAFGYHKLFHDIHKNLSPTKLPHPQFYRYWLKIQNRMILSFRMKPPPTIPRPPGFEGPEP